MSETPRLMTPDEFAAEMRELDTEYDSETGHIEADRLMLAILRHLGYGEGCDIFEKMGKWYA